MVLPISLAAAGAAALINFWLAMRIARLRGKHDVMIGDGGKPEMIAAMRAQANFIEYTPFVLILTALVEIAKGSSLALALIIGAYLIGRIAHGIGMTGDVRGRMVGTATTMLTLLGLALYTIFLSYSEW
ncbi:MAPEG family protein [Aurantiacibacter poecillastricola]|uniref:MAPEG family protein n=1 Tax=Aurantiacibacter poecillastricola TaxID=3064385 RepID=UPI0035A30D7E